MVLKRFSLFVIFRPLVCVFGIKRNKSELCWCEMWRRKDMLKNGIWRIFMYFSFSLSPIFSVFFFFFLNPQFSNPFTENVFLWRRCSGRFPLHFCFSFFFLLPSVDVDFVAQSLASGTVEEEEEEEREEQMLSSLIIIALLGKKYGKNDDGGSFKFWN